MKNIIFIALFCFIPFSVFSQKVTVQIIKVENAALSEWQILDAEDNILFSGDESFINDSVDFTLKANKRYYLHISVCEIYVPDRILYTLSLNDEPIILIKSDIESGDHLYPFFTGIRNSDAKITGGTDALISDFPWQVYYISGTYLCGGSIIDENWILTAAHCTKNSFGSPIPAIDMSVIAGATNPYNVLDGQRYYVSEVIVNEGYDSQTLENDIALLKLEQPIDIINTAPIRLITSDDVSDGATDPGVMSWVTGWGLTRVDPNVFPSNLQKVQLPIVSNDQAATVWSSIPSTDLMAGYLNGNKDACNGDSGGPLAVPLFDDYKLAGVVSWGSADCDTYGAYTRVSDFETWIREKTGIAKEYKPPPPVGDTLICQGVVSSHYSIEKLLDATAYGWKVFPSEAGIIFENSENASIYWNTSFTGSATLVVRVTIDGTVSEWSRLDLKVILNTQLLSQSVDTVICAGQPITLNVGAAGYDLTYNWYKNNQVVQSGSSEQLYISSTSIYDSGDYICEIEGLCGVEYSGIIKLTVHPLTMISNISQNFEVPFGNDVTLEVDAEGHDLYYQWQKDDIPIENSNTSQLLLYNLNATNIGLYRTTVSGTCGTEISDTVYVYVKKTDYSVEPEVFLWPSITSDEFNVALSNDEYYSVYLFNSMGNMIRELTNCRYQTTVNVSNDPGGIYFISVFNNNFRKSLKLIKK
ncbi:MAG TPA: trypsin-like serine protease [Bacteroidales bacterium]|nr:trypsin-like serine protease [Bacteroidales bacterium]